jgi:UDP-N-acetyl-D-galactosamine dehydrogenase
VILSGRRINDSVGERVARECRQMLASRGVRDAVVTVLGLTFKENVPDTRNSKVIDVIRELQSAGIAVQVHDPLADPDEAKREYGIALTPKDALKPADAVILAVAHRDYVSGGWPLLAALLRQGRGIVLDLKLTLDRSTRPKEIELWRL